MQKKVEKGAGLCCFYCWIFVVIQLFTITSTIEWTNLVQSRCSFAHWPLCHSLFWPIQLFTMMMVLCTKSLVQSYNFGPSNFLQWLTCSAQKSIVLSYVNKQIWPIQLRTMTIKRSYANDPTFYNCHCIIWGMKFEDFGQIPYNKHCTFLDVKCVWVSFIPLTIQLSCWAQWF